MPRALELRGEERFEAYSALVKYIVGVRGEPVLLRDPDQASGMSLNSVDEEPFAETLSVPRIIDTALVRAYLIAEPNKLLEFLEGEHQCDVQEWYVFCL